MHDYNYTSIETYASWVLEEIKNARKNHKKADMKKIKFWGNQINEWAEQNICFENGTVPVCGVDHS